MNAEEKSQIDNLTIEVNRLANELAEIKSLVASIAGHVQPAMEALSSSPIGKMLGV